jgi:hypothetical protein
VDRLAVQSIESVFRICHPLRIFGLAIEVQVNLFQRHVVCERKALVQQLPVKSVANLDKRIAIALSTELAAPFFPVFVDGVGTTSAAAVHKANPPSASSKLRVRIIIPILRITSSKIPERLPRISESNDESLEFVSGFR